MNSEVKNCHSQLSKTNTNDLFESDCTKSQKLEENINFSPGFVANFKDILADLACVGKRNGTIIPIQNNNMKKAAYFQNRNMTMSFSQNPEILIIHKSCEIPSTGVTIYVLVNVNKSRKLCIACLWFIKDSSRIGLLMDIFKKCNPCWQNVKVIMIAMNVEQRNLLMSKVPQAATFTCQYHAVQGFQQEIASQECFDSLSNQQIQTISAAIKAMCLATVEDHYLSYLETFEKNVEPLIFQHFRTYWEPVRDQWADRLRPESCSRFDNTGSDLENLDVQIRQLCMSKNLNNFTNSLMNLVETNLYHVKSSSVVATWNAALKKSKYASEVATGENTRPETVSNVDKLISTHNDTILSPYETDHVKLLRSKNNQASRLFRKRKRQKNAYNSYLIQRYEQENRQLRKVVHSMEDEKIILKRLLERYKEQNMNCEEKPAPNIIPDGSSETNLIKPLNRSKLLLIPKKASDQSNIMLPSNESNTNFSITILHGAEGDITIE